MQKKWLVVIAVYLASVVVIFNQYKVPPLMGGLMQQFGTDATTGGFLMSVFALTGIVLALPAALLLRYVGPRSAGMMGLGCILLGCLIGGSAAGTTELLGGRIVEGVGLSVIAVVAPAVIAMHFDHDKLGLPMGIWATWYPVGSALAYNLSQPVVEAFGSWRGSWWVGGILALLALLFYAVVVNDLHPDRQRGRSEEQRGFAAPYFAAAALCRPQIWLLGGAFFFMMLGSLGFLTWAPTYFREAFGYSQAAANYQASLGFSWSAPGGIVAGYLLTKIKLHAPILVVCSLLSTLLYTAGFLVPQEFMGSYLVSVGFVTGFTCALIFAMVPLVMESRAHTGFGMGIISMMQSAANLVATPLFGFITADGHWNAAVLPSAVILLLGIFCSVCLYRKAAGLSLPGVETTAAVLAEKNNIHQKRSF